MTCTKFRDFKTDRKRPKSKPLLQTNLNGNPLAKLYASMPVVATSSKTTLNKLMPSALPAPMIFVIWGSLTENRTMDIFDKVTKNEFAFESKY